MMRRNLVMLTILMSFAMLPSSALAHGESGETASQTTLLERTASEAQQPISGQPSEESPAGFYGFSTALDVFMSALHLLAAVVWIGGLVFLAFVLPSLSAGGSVDYDSTYRKFGSIAAASVILLIGSGIYNAIFNAPSEDGILNTGSLREHALGDAWLGVLMAKVGVVALMVALAGYMRFRILPAGANGATLTMLTRVNLVLGAVVIILAASLAYIHIVGHASESIQLLR